MTAVAPAFGGSGGGGGSLNTGGLLNTGAGRGGGASFGGSGTGRRGKGGKSITRVPSVVGAACTGPG